MLENVIALMQHNDDDTRIVSRLIDDRYRRGIYTLDEYSQMLEILADFILAGGVI